MSLAWKLYRRAACLSILGSLATTLTGCSGDGLPPAESFDEEGIEPIGRVSGHYENGSMTLSDVSSDEQGVGVKPQGFSNFTSGLVSFTTEAGDGVGTGTCSGTQYCGTTDATNATGRLMDNVIVEVTSYVAGSVTPAGAVVKLMNPVTVSTA